jgi:hypothetical protein
MGWQEERDLLIAQTMAFVQSVAGKEPHTGLGVAAKPNLATAPAVESAPVEAVKLRTAEVVTPPHAAPPKDIQVSIQIPRTVVPSDVRAEIQARVANFRAHQQRFSREREEYFSATLTKARTATDNDSTPDPSDRTPPRR